MKIVTVILVFFLFWGSVMPNNDFRELSKISHLIEHFNEHSKKTALSFFYFLNMHYGSEKEKHKDGHEGNDCLPLQNSMASTGTVFVFTNTKLFSAIPQQSKNQSIGIYLPILLVAQLKPLWHPPKA